MRLIDADAFEAVITKIPDGMDTESYIAGMDFVLAKIDNAPTIEGRKRDEWIKKKSMIYCPSCYHGFEAIFIHDYNFCPNCGMDMRGNTDDEK